MIQKIHVTERELIQRINRKLKDEGDRGQVLKKPPPGRTGVSQARLDVGEFYVVDHKDVIKKNVDLEEFGRKVGALSEWEEVL